jgi:xylulose-5-phosphate/fructose-6-phosphate phosphoketolase
MDYEVKHCTRGIGLWPWASSDQDGEPESVMAFAAMYRQWNRWQRYE